MTQGEKVNILFPAPSTWTSPVMLLECMFVVQLISTVPVQKQVYLTEPLWKHLTDIKGKSATKGTADLCPCDLSESLGTVFVQQVEKGTGKTPCALECEVILIRANPGGVS